MSNLIERRFKVIPVGDANPWPTWDSVAKNPETFIQELASRLMIETETLQQSIIISDSTPKANDRRKIWIKTSWPYGIGMLIAGEFRMDYGMSGYPQNAPFLAKDSDMSSPPDNIRKISQEESENYGLPLIRTAKIPSEQHSYYIFSPAKIAY